MKVSMNGLRQNLSEEIAWLRDQVQAVIRGEHYDEDDLRDAMNAVIQSSNVLNCVFNADDPDFSNIGHIELDLIEPDEVTA
ncbi:MAG: hypothetical protein CMI13_07710 [Oleibacter sp.]|nr:hypothetical protein [Thalassolituus sp.]|tara:strand:+ start:831 stop:1073 length:243 start_codon:yes stop_codon:yes gene_type:complete